MTSIENEGFKYERDVNGKRKCERIREELNIVKSIKTRAHTSVTLSVMMT